MSAMTEFILGSHDYRVPGKRQSADSHLTDTGEAGCCGRCEEVQLRLRSPH